MALAIHFDDWLRTGLAVGAIAHRMALFLKRRLKRDERWGRFLTQVGQARQRL